MPAAIRKDLIHVDGAVGSCKSGVAAGQLLTQLAAEPKHAKGPRIVSLEVGMHCCCCSLLRCTRAVSEQQQQ